MRQKRQDKPAFVAIWDVCRNKLEGKYNEDIQQMAWYYAVEQ